MAGVGPLAGLVLAGEGVAHEVKARRGRGFRLSLLNLLVRRVMVLARLSSWGPNLLRCGGCREIEGSVRAGGGNETWGVTASDAESFAEWVGPHLGAMGHLAARLVGPVEWDDVVQEALSRAWRKRELFDATRGSARSWLLAIVADRARRFRLRRPRSVVVMNGQVMAGPDGVMVDLERAVAKLPPRMRLAVDCVYFVDLTIAETATVMGVSEGTVKSTLSDARDRLRVMLEVS
jgi:DNA-directed RNA polymerase specialized sigma24 family protein